MKSQNTIKEQPGIKGRVRAVLINEKTKQKRIINWNKNLITTAGAQSILYHFGGLGAYSYEGRANYGAIGSGTATPAISNTALGTELARTATVEISSASVVGLTLTLQTFFTSGIAYSDISEFGLFGDDASGVSASGTLMEHALFSETFDKSTDESLTVDVEITLTI